MSTRNVNNIVLSEDKLENEDRLSKDPGDLLPMETTFSSTSCTRDGNTIKETVNEERSDLRVGRVFRKKTTPSLSEHVHQHLMTVNHISQSECGQDGCQTKKAKIGIGTQTKFRREVSVKTVRKYREGKVDIKETTTKQSCFKFLIVIFSTYSVMSIVLANPCCKYLQFLLWTIVN